MRNHRPAVPLVVVLTCVAGMALARPSISAAHRTAVDASHQQLVDLWAPERGWQIVRYRPAPPELLVIRLFGEHYVAPPQQPAGSAARQQRQPTRLPTAMPRLVLLCENGTTSLLLLLSVAGATGTRSPAGSGFGDGKIVLDLSDAKRIEIDLRGYSRPIEPIYLPEPHDTIGALRRHEAAYFLELRRGDVAPLVFGGDAWGAHVDAVFPLEGLDDLLRTTSDPCGWRAS